MDRPRAVSLWCPQFLSSLWAGARGASTPAGPLNVCLERRLRVLGLGLQNLIDAVLLDTLGVLVGVEDDAALAADDVLGSPANLRVDLAHDGGRPLISLGPRARGEGRPAGYGGIVFAGNAERPHEALAVLGVSVLDVVENRVVHTLLEDPLDADTHPETHYLIAPVL